MAQDAAKLTQSKLIAQFVSTIVDEVDPLRIILLVSRSRGEARPRSDYDLLVLEESFSSEQKKHEGVARLWNAMTYFPVQVDVLVYTLEDVAYRQDSMNHVLVRALGEGPYFMSDLKCARLLLDSAIQDIRGLRNMGNEQDFSDKLFGQHAQQAADISLKALLAIVGQEYPLIHNIAILIRRNLPLYPELERFNGLSALTPYADEIRNGANPSFRLDRKRLLAEIEDLYRFAQGALAAIS